MKKLLVAMFALILVVFLLPGAASAAGDIIASGECGDNVTWELDSQGKLTISGTGSMWDRGGETYNWYGYNITEVVVRDGVTRIGQRAFADMYELKRMTISDSVTEIGEKAFDNSYSLVTVTFQGDAPHIYSDCFRYTNIAAIYPIGNTTWTDQVKSNYGGHILWFGDTQYNAEDIALVDCQFDGWTGEVNIMVYVDTKGTLYAVGTGEFDYYDGAWDDAVPSGISRVVLGEGITGIGERAFSTAYDLTSIILPSTLTYIDKYALHAKEKLEEIRFAGDAPDIHIDAFMSTYTTAYYPAGNATWANVELSDYGGIINWVAYCFHLETETATAEPATCTKDGYAGDTICTTCGEVMEKGETIPATGHKEEAIPAVPPTCTKTGLTEGLKCSVCSEILTAQQTVPVKPHTEVADKGTAATCTTDGKTDGKHCSVCNTVTVAQQVIKATGHKEEAIKAVAPTCTATGLTEGKKCSTCGTITVAQKEVAATGHKETAIPAVAATCTKTGLTEGKKCSVCGTVTVAQKETAVAAHTEVAIPAVAPTCTKTGLTEGKKCSVCGKVTVAQQTVPLKAHTEEAIPAAAATCTTDGKTEGKKCSVCGTVTLAQQAVKATGHKETAIPAVAATCTKTGLTEGKKCSTCGTVTVAQKEVPVTGHTWDEGKITQQPTVQKPGVRTFTCKSCGTTKTAEVPFTCDHSKTKTENAREATCTAAGYTGDTLCATCGQTLKKGEAIVAKGHKEEAIKAVAPTCTATGLTEGKKCTVCGTVTVAQQTVPATGHAWDEGKVTKEPTEAAAGEKTFTCKTCKETKTETIAPLAHTHKYTDTVLKPTCTEGGYTTHTCACGHSYKDSETKATGHSFKDGKCTVCGTADPDWKEPVTEEPPRAAGENRFETASLAADQMKENLGVEKFDTVVVASGSEFADALSGSYLASAKNAPILLAGTIDWVNEDVKEYIHANLKEGGTVYILGGEKAIPTSFEKGLEKFNVKRLAGDNRFLTNLLILQEAGVGEQPILICTGLGFADSLSASATKLPILLVYGDKLLDDQAAFLEANKGRPIYIIGGTGAVNAKIEAQLKGYSEVTRLAGATRFDTSVMIAQTFFQNPKSAVLAYAWDFPDGLCGGPLAATMGAPLILTMEKYEQQATDYIQAKNIRSGFVLGGEKLIPDTSVKTIFNTR